MNSKTFFTTVIASTLLLISGCQSTQQAPLTTSLPTSTDASSTKASPEKRSFVYNPQGKEEFAFHVIADSLQKYGYEKFCPNTESFACYNRLSYSKHVGTKGYFDTQKPVEKDFSGYEFYPVVLESGDKYYYVSNPKYGGKYGSSSPIISYEDHVKLNSFKSEPFSDGSSIQLVSKESNYGSMNFVLSNGERVSEDKLKLIREVAQRFGNNPEIAEMLLNMHIKKDEVDLRYFVTPKGDSLRSEAKLYIGFNDNSEWLRFKVKYYDDDWLFVNSYKVAADDYRWQSPRLDFERDHSSGSVWEWLDTSVSEKEIEVAKAISEASKATIRFQGNKYYSDKTLEQDQKEALKDVIKLFELMKGA